MSGPTSSPILITGSTGQVGSALVQALAGLGPIHAPTRAELDLASPASIRACLRRLRPRWIVNPAAYTAVDKAESEPALAYTINAEAPRILGEEAAALGAAVLHFSTDYVFSGDAPHPYTEIEPTAPTSIYGASKLAGEHALAATGAAHLILRTSWVYGATGNNFLLTILRLARELPQLKIVADQHGAPTWSHDLARLSAHILTHGDRLAATQPLAEAISPLNGLYHATAAGYTTWFAFAQEALRLHRLAEPGVPLADLLPIPTADYPTPARRPHNSRLDCSKLHSTFHFRFPAWRSSLAQVAAQLTVHPS